MTHLHCGSRQSEKVVVRQASLTINGACPPDFFLSRLAAFLSLAVSVEGFFSSLLLRWFFDMSVTPGPNWACMAPGETVDKKLCPL